MTRATLLIASLITIWASPAFAQYIVAPRPVVTYYAPSAPVVSYPPIYASPAPVVTYSPTVYSRPVVAAPVVSGPVSTYYAPATTYSAPTTTYYSSATMSYYGTPTTSYHAPVTTYYGGTVVAPTVVRRPLLGRPYVAARPYVIW